MYRNFFKRVLDFVLSLCALLCLSPLLIVLTILGYFYMGGNPFFTQARPGKNEKIFHLVKFRSMDNRKDKDGNLLPDKVRLNKYGRLLRSTSLDELPELWNILVGDMSIIGPRPLMPEYLPYYTEEERHRHDVRPGLSGLAQVNGRSFITWEEIFAYDLKYVRNISFMQDVSIVLNTIKKVICRKDIADATISRVDEYGKKHYIVNGKDYVIHQPLNVERKDKNA